MDEQEKFDSGVIPVASPVTQELTYAPPVRSSSRAVWVLAAGALSSAVAMLVVYLLERYARWNAMGFFLFYLVPAGAMAVGFLAGLGFLLSAMGLVVRINGWKAVAAFFILISSYFGNEYVRFASMGRLMIVRTTVSSTGASGMPIATRLGFWEYFHMKTQSWRWDSPRGFDSDTSRLNLWGYAFVGLDLLGYCGVGMFLCLLTLSGGSYCALCERAWTSKTLGKIPASQPAETFTEAQAAEAEAFARQQQQIWAAAAQSVEAALEQATAGDVTMLISLLRECPVSEDEVDQLPARIRISMVYCSSCSDGTIRASVLVGHGDYVRATSLGEAKPPASVVGRLRNEFKL